MTAVLKYGPCSTFCFIHDRLMTPLHTMWDKKCNSNVKEPSTACYHAHPACQQDASSRLVSIGSLIKRGKEYKRWKGLAAAFLVTLIPVRVKISTRQQIVISWWQRITPNQYTPKIKEVLLEIITIISYFRKTHHKNTYIAAYVSSNH